MERDETNMERETLFRSGVKAEDEGRIIRIIIIRDDKSTFLEQKRLQFPSMNTAHNALCLGIPCVLGVLFMMPCVLS